MRKAVLRLVKIYGFIILAFGLIYLGGYVQNDTQKRKLSYLGDFLYTVTHPDEISEFFNEEVSYSNLYRRPADGKITHRKDSFYHSYFLTTSYFKKDTFYAQKLIVPKDSTVAEFAISQEDIFNDIYKRSWSMDGPMIQLKELSQTRPMHFLFDNDQVIFSATNGPLFCYNWKTDQKNWLNSDYIFHHSIEQDSTGALWACGLTKRQHPMYVLNYMVVKVDPQTGKTKFKKRIFDIMKQSPELHKLNFFGNSYARKDIHHLNDIQPIYTDNGLDLLISIRDMNLILRYHPRKDSLLDYSIGLGQKQHDVDFYDGNIYVFSNNDPYYFVGKEYNTINYQSLENMRSDSIHYFHLDWFEKNRPYTIHQGQQEILNDSTFMVEETEVGLLYLVEGEKERQYCYPHPDDGSWVSMLGWGRFELMDEAR